MNTSLGEPNLIAITFFLVFIGLSLGITIWASRKTRTLDHFYTAGRSVTRVEPPSTRYRTDQPGNFLRLAVPENWEQVARSDGGVTYAPDAFDEKGDYRNEADTLFRRIGAEMAPEDAPPMAGPK